MPRTRLSGIRRFVLIDDLLAGPPSCSNNNCFRNVRQRRHNAHRAQSKRINKRNWIALYISVGINPARQPNRILSDEPPQPRVIVPRPVVIQPRPVIFPPRVLERVCARLALHRRRPVGLITVRRPHLPRPVRQPQHRAQRIRHHVSRPGRVRAAVVLVHAQTGQQASACPCGAQFLYRVDAVIHTRLRPIDQRRRYCSALRIYCFIEQRDIVEEHFSIFSSTQQRSFFRSHPNCDAHPKQMNSLPPKGQLLER